MHHRGGFAGTLIELFKALLFEQRKEEHPTERATPSSVEEEDAEHGVEQIYDFAPYSPEVISELVKQDIEESKRQGFETGAETEIRKADKRLAPPNMPTTILRCERKGRRTFGIILIAFGLFISYVALTWIMLAAAVGPRKLNLSIEIIGFIAISLVIISLVFIAVGRAIKKRAKEHLIHIAPTRTIRTSSKGKERFFDLLASVVFGPIGVAAGITFIMSPVYLGFQVWHLWPLWRASLGLESCVTGLIMMLLPPFLAAVVVGYIVNRLCFFRSWWGEDLLGAIILSASTVPAVWVMADTVIPDVSLPFVSEGALMAASFFSMLPNSAQTMYTLQPLDTFSLLIVAICWGLFLGEAKGSD